MAADDREAPRDLTATVVRGVSLAGSGYLLAQVLNLSFFIVLARLLVPADFGKFAAATVLVSLSLLVTESGLASAVVQRRDRLEAAAATAVVATAVSGITVSLLALAAAPLMAPSSTAARSPRWRRSRPAPSFSARSRRRPTHLLQRQFSFVRTDSVIEPAQVLAFGSQPWRQPPAPLGPWSSSSSAQLRRSHRRRIARVDPRPLAADLRLVSFAMWRGLVAYGRHVFVATAVLRVGDSSAPP